MITNTNQIKKDNIYKVTYTDKNAKIITLAKCIADGVEPWLLDFKTIEEIHDGGEYCTDGYYIVSNDNLNKFNEFKFILEEITKEKTRSIFYEFIFYEFIF